MKEKWTAKILLMLMLAIAQFSIKVLAFPQVIDWKNSPIIIFENKVQAVLKKNTALKSPFAVVTANQDQLEFKINIFDRVVVYPKSRVQVLEFSDDAGFVSEFYILDGQIRFATFPSSVAKDAAVVTLKTPFFDLKTAGVADFIVNLNMKESSVEIKMIAGVLPLEFFAHEKSLNLKAGESVKFQGVSAEDGIGIKYHYLLNKRKVPKGVMGEVQKFDQSFFVQNEKNIVLEQAKQKKSLQRKAENIKRKQKEYEDLFLCKNPFAQKDQCAWWQEESKCYRKRCNVSGQWGDFIERPVTENCKKDFSVNKCDY